MYGNGPGVIVGRVDSNLPYIFLVPCDFYDSSCYLYRRAPGTVSTGTEPLDVQTWLTGTWGTRDGKAGGRV